MTVFPPPLHHEHNSSSPNVSSFQTTTQARCQTGSKEGSIKSKLPNIIHYKNELWASF